MAEHTETDFEHAIEHSLTMGDRYRKVESKMFDRPTALFRTTAATGRILRLQ